MSLHLPRRVALLVLAGALAGQGCGSDSPPRREAGSPRDVRELAAQWWRWATSERRDPVRDPTGARCTRGQPEGVFFLAGTPGGAAQRTCEVPAGVRVFLPILNRVCPTEGAAASDAADACGEGLERAELELSVDGRPHRTEYVESAAFELDPDPGSFVGETRGEVVAVGHHALLDPLAPGRHTVAFRGDDRDGFALDVRYRLTVQEGRRAAASAG